MQWLSIAAGGALGAMARHGLALLAVRWLGERFPWGTLLANALGSLALGFLMQWFAQRQASDEVRLLLTTGFLGAFTTFSTYSVQSVRLMEEGSTALALANVVGNVVLGLALATLGIALARQLA
jgi:CrcB protein